MKFLLYGILLLYFIVEVCVKPSNGKQTKNWYIGRVPPSRFEYEKLNGYYSPKHAKELCKNDIQCGGFTFKGTKQDKRPNEVYFFHFIDFEHAYMKYPHWTFYIPSRTYGAMSGKYLSDSVKLSSAQNIKKA